MPLCLSLPIAAGAEPALYIHFSYQLTPCLPQCIWKPHRLHKHHHYVGQQCSFWVLYPLFSLTVRWFVALAHSGSPLRTILPAVQKPTRSAFPPALFLTTEWNVSWVFLHNSITSFNTQEGVSWSFDWFKLYERQNDLYAKNLFGDLSYCDQ